VTIVTPSVLDSRLFAGDFPFDLCETACQVLDIAAGIFLTGLTFVRFSRPQAKFVFAPHPVVTVHSGKPTLMLRIGNGRTGAHMDVAATKFQKNSHPSINQKFSPAK
jgi:hypothetical protein